MSIVLTSMRMHMATVLKIALRLRFLMNSLITMKIVSSKYAVIVRLVATYGGNLKSLELG